MPNEIAQTIVDQIRTSDRWAFGAWGASRFVSSDNALTFKVIGAKFRGNVQVIYNSGSDVYTVVTGKIRTVKRDGFKVPEYKEVGRVDDVYCEMLVSVIDGMIER